MQVTDYKVLKFEVRKTEVSGLQWKLTFKRNIAPFVTQYFILSTFLVLVAFSSFWVSQAVVPARVALVVTTFLSQCVIIRGTKLHGITYLTALEIFLLTYMIFILLCLLELMVVLHVESFLKRLPCRTLASAKNPGAELDSKPVTRRHSSESNCQKGGFVLIINRFLIVKKVASSG